MLGMSNIQLGYFIFTGAIAVLSSILLYYRTFVEMCYHVSRPVHTYCKILFFNPFIYTRSLKIFMSVR